MSRAWMVAPSLIEEFLKNHVEISYHKGQIVFSQGSPADIVYWLSRGIVELYRWSRKGKRLLVRLAGPSELIGGADMTDDQGDLVQGFEARARTNCEIVLITREHIFRVIEHLGADKFVRLLTSINRAWGDSLIHLSDFLLGDCRERLRIVLTDLALRFGAADARGIVLTVDVTHQDFADLVGFSRALTSRLIGELIQDNVLARSDKRYVLPAGSELARPIIEAAQRSLNGSRRRRAVA